MPSLPPSPRLEGVLLRSAHADDETDLIRLASLEGVRPLAGPALLAEENGVTIAALCLSTGRAVADPFLPSAHLVELLRQHAAGRRARSTSPGRQLLFRLALRVGSGLLGAKGSS